MESEKNAGRKYLSKITPFENNEITDMYPNYEQLSELSTKLFDTTKSGNEYRESLLKKETGFDEYVTKNYGTEELMNKR